MAKNDDDKEYYNKVFGTGGSEWDWGQLIRKNFGEIHTQIPRD